METYKFIKGTDESDRLEITTPHKSMIVEMSLIQIQQRRIQLETDLAYFQILEAKYIELRDKRVP